MLEINLDKLKREYIHYVDRSIGPRQHPLMEAHNVALEGQKPDWRVAENELVRWLRYKGFRIYHRGSMSR